MYIRNNRNRSGSYSVRIITKVNRRNKVVAFGHTHEPMLEVYPPGKQYTSIYANSGSWVNADDCSHKVRTYLIINPAEWTGSNIDVVLLYQYNLDSNSGDPDPPYKPVLISEENIDVNK